jgi:hypothetical protein
MSHVGGRPRGKMTPMSGSSHHPDRGVVYVGPSLTSSLVKAALALAAASR